MRIDMQDVPLGARRRVAQLLENIRGTEMDPTGGRAALAGEVNAIYRPDLKEVAYYEFVVDLGRDKGRQIAVSGRGSREARLPARQGFVIAASNVHDHPVAHFSLDREPPSHQIRGAAEAEGGKLARLFKLDALCYAGEDEGGALLGQTGQMPMPIDGLLDDVAKMKGRVSATLSRPAALSETDETPTEKRELVSRGPRKPQTRIGEVGSWEELREGYREAFGPLLEGLKQSAAPAWEVEALVREMGEGVMTGTVRKVALLEPDASVELSGEGADLVKLETMQTTETGGCVALHIADARLEREMSFDLHISYRSGLREHLMFFAVSPSTPSGSKADNSLTTFEE